MNPECSIQSRLLGCFLGYCQRPTDSTSGSWRSSSPVHCGQSSHISVARKERGCCIKALFITQKVLNGLEALRGDVQIRITSGNQEYMEMGSWLLFQKKKWKFQDIAEDWGPMRVDYGTSKVNHEKSSPFLKPPITSQWRGQKEYESQKAVRNNSAPFLGLLYRHDIDIKRFTPIMEILEHELDSKDCPLISHGKLWHRIHLPPSFVSLSTKQQESEYQFPLFFIYLVLKKLESPQDMRHALLKPRLWCPCFLSQVSPDPNSS